MTRQLLELIAVITGAGSGLGEYVAKALAGKGMSVALVGRRADRLAEVARSIRDAGGKAMPFPCDVTNPRDVATLHARVRGSMGVATLLFNGAGVFGEVVPILESDPDRWLAALSTNVAGPYLMCRAFTPGMIENRWGRIINVSSAAAFHPPFGHSSAYQLTKVALNWFTRQLAAELSGSGVTVNVIHPGEVKTEMWASIKAESEAKGNQGMLSWAKMVEETGGDPPEKTVELVLDLLDPRSDGLSGQFLWIRDGLKKPMPTW
jgi:3-oxoacyl-[acyl-carrier protein] reductase